MSDDSEKQKNSVHVEASKNPILNRNKFTLIDGRCETNLDSIRKLNDDKRSTSEQYCLSTELNNNYIQTFVEGSGVFKMDSKRNYNDKKPINATAPIATTTASSTTTTAVAADWTGREKDNKPANGTPAYASIFSSNQQQQQKNPSRGQLKKQGAAELEELPVATIDRLSQGKKLTSFDGHYKNSEDDDDNEDDEIDERLPFSSGMTKHNQASGYGRKSQEHHQHRGCSLPLKHSALLHQQDSRCEYGYPHNNNNNNKHNNPNTKISFENCRPPSFDTCQFNHHNENGSCGGNKLDGWRKQCSHSSCGCHGEPYRNSNKSLKHGIAHKEATPDTVYSKTRYFHLMLKSIILVLLTLLLLILFIGIILASHYLPQMFDRILSATRSFNVTIAG